MFVQYSFVQRRPVTEATVTPRRPFDLPHFEMTPSMVVATGVGCMVLTACAFLLA